MLQMRRSRLLAELRIYFESGRGCFAKASTVVIMRACSSTVEQGTHNPLVLGSNPGGPTNCSVGEHIRVFVVRRAFILLVE